MVAQFNRKGLRALLLILVLELILLCFTATRHIPGLAWINRKDTCMPPGSSEYTIVTEYYINYACVEGISGLITVDRECFEYIKDSDTEKEFGLAGTIVYVSLGVIGVLVAFTLCNLQATTCGASPGKGYSSALLFLCMGRAVICFFAVHLVSETEAMQAGVRGGCTKAWRYPGYGLVAVGLVGASSLIVAAVTVCPCNSSIVEQEPTATVTGQVVK